jgi:hypothetical protein
MGMIARGRILAILMLLFAAFVVDTAAAKTSYESPYTYQQTFGTALRLLKVDLGHEVTELNSEWGYILFVYVDSESGKRKNRGAITFVKGKKTVDVSIDIPQMPSYHEELMLQKLKHKLQKEHGEPPPPPADEDEGDDDEGDDDDDDDDEGDDDQGKKKKSK